MLFFKIKIKKNQSIAPFGFLSLWLVKWQDIWYNGFLNSGLIIHQLLSNETVWSGPKKKKTSWIQWLNKDQFIALYPMTKKMVNEFKVSIYIIQS